MDAEALDVVEHVSAHRVVLSVCFSRGSLGFQRREGALLSCIVPNVNGAAHRTDDVVVGHQTLELSAGILADSVEMVQRGVLRASAPDGHNERAGDELGCHRHLYRLSDQAPGIQGNPDAT